MPKFKIIYEQEQYAALSPLDAAKKIRQDIIDGEALCFTVINEETNEEFSVDLGEEDDNAVYKINYLNDNTEKDEIATLIKNITGSVLGSSSFNEEITFTIGQQLIVIESDEEAGTIFCTDLDKEDEYSFDLKEFNEASILIKVNNNVVVLKDISGDSMKGPYLVDFEKTDMFVIKDINLKENTVICTVIDEDGDEELNESFAFDLIEFKDAIQIIN